MSELDIKSLFGAGAHFGHRTSRWHPKMSQFIHSKRGGIHIIDLEKTLERLNEALKFVERVAADGKMILLVGTKRQARSVVVDTAKACGMPYVTERWLGGTLTNFQTISTRINRLKQLETQMASGELASKYSKLEVQRFQEEIDRLNVTFGGVKDMTEQPSALVVFDVHGESLAVAEAKKLGIPVVGIVDTNTDPTQVDYPIPANDDAIKTLTLVAQAMADVIKSGKSRAKAPAPAEGNK